MKQQVLLFSEVRPTISRLPQLICFPLEQPARISTPWYTSLRIPVRLSSQLLSTCMLVLLLYIPPLAVWEINSVDLPGLERPAAGGALLLILHCLFQAGLAEDVPARPTEHAIAHIEEANPTFAGCFALTDWGIWQNHGGFPPLLPGTG